MIPAAIAAAKAMFAAARIEASQEDLDVLAEDIAGLAEEELFQGVHNPDYTFEAEDYLRAASLLGKRIGGLKSLRTYVDVLKREVGETDKFYKGLERAVKKTRQ